MKIQKGDLYSRNSLTLALLNQLEEEERRIRAQADRLWGLDIALTAYIQEGKITDTDEISCAISWLNHSNLSPVEILNKVLDKERK